MQRIIGYFLRGLLVILPLGITVMIIFRSIAWIDSLLQLKIPGLGLLIVIGGIFITGIVFSGFIGKHLLALLDQALSKTPLVSLIYSSIKDLIDSFIGDKRKFTEPVLISIYSDGVQAMGFVTRRDLTELGLKDKSAVYLPYSYAISGHVLIVDNSKITPLHANPSEVMKFLVSAGITGFAEVEEEKK
ncbi:MAG: DUF502 domain-containing protein [Bacteroidetes bacterium]|nr:DUF502 domain-containing protein [Bacteroidota bacterium]